MYVLLILAEVLQGPNTSQRRAGVRYDRPKNPPTPLICIIIKRRPQFIHTLAADPSFQEVKQGAKSILSAGPSLYHRSRRSPFSTWLPAI